jgi:NAD(P)H-flavin reductase/ferredoxin
MNSCKVTVNDQTFSAQRGELLLDSAIMNGIELPHDCRTGVCGSCRVRLIAGKVLGGDSSGCDLIHACQARIVSDLKVATEAVPHPVSESAKLVRLTHLAAGILGVTIELNRPFNFLSGQYCKLQFRGFPGRYYSPSYPLEGASRAHLLHFQIQKLADGAVSCALGDRIQVGHRVKLTGPFGGAFFRPNHAGRVVLVSSGTGFAPMWSIAVEAITERPRRELTFVVATRTLQSFYMHRALCRLALFPNVTIIPLVAEPQDVSPAIRIGRPIDFLPTLSSNDVIYAAGIPTLTKQVARAAKATGARFHADPFVSHAELMRAPSWLKRPLRARAPFRIGNFIVSLRRGRLVWLA